MTKTDLTENLVAKVMQRYGCFWHCDFKYSTEHGVYDFSAHGSGETTDKVTIREEMDDCDAEHVDAMKSIILAIIERAFPNTADIDEMDGQFYNEEGKIYFGIFKVRHTEAVRTIC